MAGPVLEIAKSGEDLTTAGSVDMALDSDLLLPKIYMVKELTPDGSGNVSYTHGLGYPPMFLYYEQQQYLQSNPAYEEFDPNRFIWGSQNRYYTMDSTEFTTTVGGISNDAYLVLFLDPLEEPGTEPSPTTTSRPRLRVGDAVGTDADYKNRIDSKYQTLKVYMTGELECDLDAFNATSIIGGDNEQTDWFSVEHGLGYPPIFTPFGINTVGLDLMAAYDESIPSSFSVNDVNDLFAEKWAYSLSGSYIQYEIIWIYVDEDYYYLGYQRKNLDAASGYNFPARTVTVDYTIFNNPINEEFDLSD
jgi:hypothetical protein